MADNVTITAGSGTTIAADEVTDGTLGSVKVQYIKVMDGALDGTNKMSISSSGEVAVKGTVSISALTTASKIQTEFAAAQAVTLSTASAVQVEPKSGASFTIGALTTASKIQTEFAVAQAVTLTTASKVQAEFAAAQAVTLSTASALQVEPKAGASFTIAALTTSSKINVEANSSFAISALTSASKITIEGDVASGSADAGNPLKIGGKAATALPTTVASGNRVNALYDTLGRQIVSGTLRENLGVQNTAVSTIEVAIVSSSTGLRDLYGLILANYGSVATRVDVRDSAAGTIRASFYVPANDTRGLMLPVDSAIPQASTGAAWTATNVTTTATVQASAYYVTRL